MADFRPGAHRRELTYQCTWQLQRFTQTADDLDQLEKLSRLRLKLIAVAMWLAIFGLVLTISVAEICRYGYIPTEEEIAVCASAHVQSTQRVFVCVICRLVII